MPVPPLIAVGTLCFLGACCASDLRAREIPNWLSMGGALAGLLLNYSLLGVWGLTGGLLGLLIAVAVLLAPFALGGVGGGDVKMMGAVGAFVGPGLVLVALAAGMIAGGVVAAAHLLYIGRLAETLSRLRGMVAGAWRSRSLEPLRVSSTAAGAITLPYSIPLAIGTMAAFVYCFSDAWPL